MGGLRPPKALRAYRSKNHPSIHATTSHRHLNAGLGLRRKVRSVEFVQPPSLAHYEHVVMKPKVSIFLWFSLLKKP